MDLVRSFIERFLEPSEWLGEVLFGLVMALTISLGAGALVPEGPGATREIIVSVVGCILAWSFIDAMIYVMHGIFERSRITWLIEAIQSAANKEHALGLIQKEIEPVLIQVTTESERTRLYGEIFSHVQTATIPRTVLRRQEVVGGLLTFLMVLSTAVPAILPLLIIPDRRLALTASNVLLLGMLSLVGFFWARRARTNSLLTSLFVLLVGTVMVGIAKLLGG